MNTQPNLDMDVMRTLSAAQQLGGLNRAAERVGRSQSAVSQQMRKLEEQVGVPLFRKQGRGLALTEAGGVILSYARRILDLNDEAVTAARGAAVEGVVRFGLPGDFAETWLPQTLGRFNRAHPGVRVEVVVDRNRVLLERLDRGELDLALVLGDTARKDAQRLATLPMQWIGPAGMNPLIAPGEPLDLAVYHEPCFFRHAAIDALDKAGLAWRVAFTTSSPASLWAAVGAGLGVTLRTATGLPQTLQVLDERAGLPPTPKVDLCLYSAQTSPSPALARLRVIVTETVAQNLGHPANAA